MAHKIGPASWNLHSKPEAKQRLTPEMVDAKAREVAQRHGDILMHLGLAITAMAEAGDVLALECLTVAVKALLADGVHRCADAVDALNIME